MNCSLLGSYLRGIFFRQEYWGGLPFPSPEDLPNSGIELVSLVSPALAGRVFTAVLPGKLIHARRKSLERWVLFCRGQRTVGDFKQRCGIIRFVLHAGSFCAVDGLSD